MTDNKLISTLTHARDFCLAAENCTELGREEFIDAMLTLLPQLYMDFSTGDTDAEEEYIHPYVDEEHYESIRRRVAALLGEDDMYLETFEEDMKYSDTPIAASIGECIADMYQDLFNFVAAVRESGGDSLAESFAACRDNFRAYWSQTLCNVMRALNRLRFHQ